MYKMRENRQIGTKSVKKVLKRIIMFSLVVLAILIIVIILPDFFCLGLLVENHKNRFLLINTFLSGSIVSVILTSLEYYRGAIGWQTKVREIMSGAEAEIELNKEMLEQIDKNNYLPLLRKSGLDGDSLEQLRIFLDNLTQRISSKCWDNISLDTKMKIKDDLLGNFEIVKYENIETKSKAVHNIQYIARNSLSRLLMHLEHINISKELASENDVVMLSKYWDTIVKDGNMRL